MARENLTVVELLIQLLQGAKEARKVLYKYAEIPKLNKLHVTLSVAQGKEAGAGANFYVGLKQNKKSDYGLTKTYNFSFDEEEKNPVALNLNTKSMFASFGVDLQTGLPALSEEGDIENKINQIIDADYNALENKYGKNWELQTKNLSLDFASALVRHASELYQSVNEVPGVKIEPFTYEESFVIGNTKNAGLYLEFFGVSIDIGSSWEKSVTHSFVAYFG